MSTASLSATLDDVFDQRITPVIFPHEPSESPELMFVAGQSGVTAARAAGALVGGREIAVLSTRDLRAFHPRYLELSRSRSSEADRALTESATTWMRSALRYARTTRRSILVDAAPASPDVALATTRLFESDGFRTSIAIVSCHRSESLLAATSAYLLAARTGRAAPFATLAAHDAEFETVGAIVETLESEPSVDRLTIIGRDGSVEFHAKQSDVGGFAGARSALSRVQSAAQSAPQIMRWLSELRAITDYALSAGRVAQPLAEVLVELHETGLREMLPSLSLPSDTRARPAAEEGLSRRLGAIQKASRASNRSPQHAPVISAPEPERGIDR